MRIRTEQICERNGWRLYGEPVYCDECGGPLITGDSVFYCDEHDDALWFCSQRCLEDYEKDRQEHVDDDEE